MTDILVINGHPDPAPERFAAALSEAYAVGAGNAGHRVDRLAVGELPVDFLRNKAEFSTRPDGPLRQAQDAIERAQHLVVVYPLWLGTAPARLKAFFEHAARGDFFLKTGDSTREWPAQMMQGRSVRLIVTMGMPGIIYRVALGAHSVKGVETGIFRMSGFKPVRTTLFGMVEGDAARRTRMLTKAGELGRRAA